MSKGFKSNLQTEKMVSLRAGWEVLLAEPIMPEELPIKLGFAGHVRAELLLPAGHGRAACKRGQQDGPGHRVGSSTVMTGFSG